MSEQPVQPDFLPDKYEPGSHNAIGIAGLAAGVKWVAEQTVEKLYEHDRDLVRTFIDGASDVDGFRYHGPQGVRDRIGVFSVQIDGYDAHELAVILETTYGILTRPGIHCAPLAHAAFGTADCGGTTRLSFGPFLSKQDVKYATDALAEISATRASSAAVPERALLCSPPSQPRRNVAISAECGHSRTFSDTAAAMFGSRDDCGEDPAPSCIFAHPFVSPAPGAGQPACAPRAAAYTPGRA
jgi:hypothetical protein